MAIRPTVLFALAAASLFAQKTFEVATIKPNAENDNRVMFRILPGGGFSATGATLRMLITQAYNIKDFQVTGGPGWLATDRFDVNAKAEATTERVSPETFRPMLQSLLDERFLLKFHKETKEMPVYALVAGKGPHKMKAAETPAGSDPQRRQMMRIGRGQANLQGTTMAGLAQLLSQQLGRPVIDKTGIQGAFDVELRWTPEPGQGGGPFGGAPPPPEAIAQSDNSGPSIFTAIQEQLGLKLDSTKGPVEIMIIDSATKPTEN
jgi:uncharacterized protein (TIGR03435 family)